MMHSSKFLLLQKWIEQLSYLLEEPKVTRTSNFLKDDSKDAIVESSEIEVPRSPYDEVVMEDEDIYQMIVSPKNLGANDTLTTSPILPEMLVENEEVEVEEIVSQSVDTNFAINNF